MITLAQRKMAKAHGGETILNKMWEQRRRWWFNHMLGNHDREAAAAMHGAKLHHELIVKTGIPDLLIGQWERSWDDWFEKQLRFMAKKLSA